jgi:thioredoxin 1
MVKVIPITRMDCPTCIPVLEKEVLRLEGVEEVRGNYMAKNLKVTYNSKKVQLAEIEAAIERVGYRIAYKKYPGFLGKIKGLFNKEDRGKVEIVTDKDFTRKVLNSSKTVAVMFSSPTCPTCRIFKPQFEKLAEKTEGKADLFEMNISITESWRSYNIMSIPTILVFKSGEVVEKFIAMPSTKELSEALGI